ncbi:MAG: SIS domain-containing protein [Cellulosilyticaceae bacterium]
MSEIFGMSANQLESIGATFTACEIYQQPKLWEECINIIKNNQEQFSTFMNKVLSIPNLQIVLTGAGTSAYVGDTIYTYIEKVSGKPTFATATTDVVSNPKQFIKKDVPTLLVSFARSGNSPESVGTYDLFEQCCDEVYNLVVTCNNEGALAKKAMANGTNLVVLMPAASNDKSFAMTSSFTCMMFSTLLLFNLSNLDAVLPIAKELIENAYDQLDHTWSAIKEVANLRYNRIVYLGSGALKGLCHEMALKNLELTSGQYITVCESTLGFRHGPKSIINDETLVIFLTSNDAYTHQYDCDLIKEVYSDQGNHKVITLSYAKENALANISDVHFSAHKSSVEDVFAAFNYILFGQVFALFNSINLGISPDNPRPDGTVNRVVQGVTIHPFK